MRRITLYTRSGCHLCEDALHALKKVGEQIPFDLSERDIDAEEALQRRYFDRVPVVELDGQELFEAFVDEDLLRDALSGSGS